MNKKQIAKASLDDLIAKKLAKDKRTGSKYQIFVPSLDKNLEFIYPDDVTQLEFLEKLSDKFADNVRAYTELIYISCPMLQDKKLQEAFEVVDPYDTVSKIFNPSEILNIGAEISTKLGSSVVDEIKN